ncbi:MAG: hypothetical protein OXD01_05025 [Gammaproteobacteria bacterium]|nr:hypothetical protein [Gammaproteobacteria bacterium]
MKKRPEYLYAQLNENMQYIIRIAVALDLERYLDACEGQEIIKESKQYKIYEKVRSGGVLLLEEAPFIDIRISLSKSVGTTPEIGRIFLRIFNRGHKDSWSIEYFLEEFLDHADLYAEEREVIVNHKLMEKTK